MSETPSIRVAIVEDQADVRQELEAYLSRSPGLHVVAAVGSAEEALRVLPPLAPEVTLMDILLPGMNGVECVRRLKPLLPCGELLMLTVFDDDRMVFDSLVAGASGYLLRKTAPDRIAEAVRELHAGGSVMSPSIARKMIAAFARGERAADPLAVLTVREREVLERLSRGWVYKEISNELGLSPNTIRTHVHRIYKKLHLRSKAEAIQRFGPAR